jgi:uncharacterized protein DUF5939
MSETQALFSVLRQTADPEVVDAIQNLVAKGEDRDLNRVNLLDFSRKTGLPACFPARPVRSRLERALPRLRRRARRPYHSEVAAPR